MSEATLPVQAAAPPRPSEDLVAVGLGLGVFLLALVSLAGADALGVAGDDIGLDRPLDGACARLEGRCGLGRGGRAAPHLRGPHRRSVRGRLSARRGCHGASRLPSRACLQLPMRVGSSVLGRISPP